ncbi:hypothetical protein [Klebsiella pneumoniae]|uniref:hypothetical protein n=1 Tax=Klebsiella pneumoniae TaxID=573 RepID=UPI001A935A39|nr:hypothetical protein [Klebsiella pneumoniae]
MKMTKESLLKVIGAVDDVTSALAGTNDEVHKDDTDKMVRLWDDLNDQYAPPEVVRELARMALAAMDSEPVAWTWHYREQWHVTNDKCRAEFVAKDGDVAVLPLYRHAQPAPISEQVLPLQDKDLQGVIDALEHPAGINAAGKQVVRHALAELQERRKADSEPVILFRQVNPANGMKTYWAELDPEEFRHLKQHTDENAEFMTLYRHAQQPVVEREPIAWLNDAYLARGVVDGEAGSEDAGPGYIPVYREAGPQPAPVVPDEMLCEFYEVDSWPDLVRELVKHVEQLQDSARRNVKPWEDTFPETLLPAYIERVKQADDACRDAMLAAAPQEVK